MEKDNCMKIWDFQPWVGFKEDGGSCGVCVWKGIMQSYDAFVVRSGFQVGNGKKIDFWED